MLIVGFSLTFEHVPVKVKHHVVGVRGIESNLRKGGVYVRDTIPNVDNGSIGVYC